MKEPVTNCGGCNNVCSIALGFKCYNGLCIDSNYQVPGTIPIGIETKPLTCWAAAATLLYSSMMQESYDIPEVMNIAGPIFSDLYYNGMGLEPEIKPLLLNSLGFAAEPDTAINYPLESWAYLLQRYGPLWVTINTGEQYTHAYLIIGINGNFLPAESSITYIDAGYSGVLVLDFEEFDRQFTGTGVDNIRIVHKKFP